MTMFVCLLLYQRTPGWTAETVESTRFTVLGLEVQEEGVGAGASS